MHDEITIPKGTILHLHGCPIELETDITVHSPTIAHYGSLEAFNQEWGTAHVSDPAHPTSADSGDIGES